MFEEISLEFVTISASVLAAIVAFASVAAALLSRQVNALRLADENASELARLRDALDQLRDRVHATDLSIVRLEKELSFVQSSFSELSLDDTRSATKASRRAIQGSATSNFADPLSVLSEAVSSGDLERAISALERMEDNGVFEDHLDSIVYALGTIGRSKDPRLTGFLLRLLDYIPQDGDELRAYAAAAHAFRVKDFSEGRAYGYLERVEEFVSSKEFSFPNTNKAFASNQVGMIYWSLERYEESLKWSTLAHELDSRVPSYLYNMSLCQAKLGDNSAALISAKRSVELAEEFGKFDADHLDNLVDLYFAAGDLAQAGLINERLKEVSERRAEANDTMYKLSTTDGNS